MTRRDGVTPTMVDALDVFERAMRRRVRVALPGKVLSYDASTERAEVEPQVPNILRKRDTQERVLEWPPVLPSVPVQFPGGGGVRITWPLKKGDTVTLLCHDRMIAEWLRTGSKIDPGDERMQHLGSAIALPGLLTEDGVSDAGGSQPDHFVIETADGTEIRLGSKDPEAALARADKVEKLWNAFVNATPGTTDSGAAIQTAVKEVWNNLSGTGLDPAQSVGAEKVKGD